MAVLHLVNALKAHVEDPTYELKNQASLHELAYMNVLRNQCTTRAIVDYSVIYILIVVGEENSVVMSSLNILCMMGGQALPGLRCNGKTLP